LRRADQRSHHAALVGLVTDGADDQAVLGDVAFDARPGIGAFTGSLPLSRFATEAPVLPVELRSHYWFLWPFLVILAGVVLAGVMLQRYSLQRRRARAGHALDNTVNEYCEVHAKYAKAVAAGNAPEIWELAAVQCGTRRDNNWESYDDLDTNGRIAAALYWARNDDDLAEAEAAILALIVRVKSWLLVLSCVQRLDELRQPRHDRREKHWADTCAALDAEVVLDAAKREPVDAVALKNRIRFQAHWVCACVAVWDLFAEYLADDSFDYTKVGALSTKFDDVDATAVPSAARTAEQQKEWLYKLTRLYAELDALNPRLGPDGSPQPRQLPAPPPDQRETDLTAELGLLKRHEQQPQIAMAASSQIRPGQYEPDVANDAQEAGAQEDGANAANDKNPLARALARGESPDVWVGARRGQGRRLLKRYQRGDLLLTALILALTSLAYAVTVYDDTWGSPGQWVSAFLAGVTGQVVVAWAALPLYRSVRMRAQQGTTEPAPGK
jgi:hypothetical protein